MGRYAKNNGFCKNHPGIEALPHRNYCRVCHNKTVAERRRQRKKENPNFFRTIKSKTIQPKEELERLIGLKYNNKSIAVRYLVSASTVWYWLDHYKIEPYHPRLDNNERPDIKSLQCGTITPKDVYFNVRPKKY